MTKKYSLHFSLFEKSDALVQMDSSTDWYKWAIPVSQTSPGTLQIRSYNVTEKL